MDMKMEGTQKLFLVKWKGFSAKYNTWEPVSNLIDFKDEMAELERFKNEEQGEKAEEEEEAEDSHAQMSRTKADTSEPTLYLVDKLLDMKMEGTQKLFLVKWKGFSAKYNTWEPVSNLIDFKDEMAELERFKNEEQGEKAEEDEEAAEEEEKVMDEEEPAAKKLAKAVEKNEAPNRRAAKASRMAISDGGAARAMPKRGGPSAEGEPPSKHAKAVAFDEKTSNGEALAREAGRLAEWAWAQRHGLADKFTEHLVRKAELNRLAAVGSRLTRKRVLEVDTMVTHALVPPAELLQEEADFLERLGLGGYESPLRSFHGAVVDCLEGEVQRQVNTAKHELLFFVRRCGGTCTGLAMVARRRGPSLRTRGTVFEMRRIASAGSKGSGAQLHWHLCDALVRYAVERCGWHEPDELSMVLTLQSCTWRAGGFYKKMGWEALPMRATRGGRSASLSVDDIGGMMHLNLLDRPAWSQYWQPGATPAAERAAAERAAAESAAGDKAADGRAAAEKADAERLASEKDAASFTAAEEEAVFTAAEEEAAFTAAEEEASFTANANAVWDAAPAARTPTPAAQSSSSSGSSSLGLVSPFILSSSKLKSARTKAGAIVNIDASDWTAAYNPSPRGALPSAVDA